MIRNFFKRKKPLVAKKQPVKKPKTKISQKIEKPAEKILTAEGWKRLMIRKKTKKL